MKPIPKILVIGAGISGMVAALSLAEQGAAVELMTNVPLGRTNGMRASNFLNILNITKSSAASMAAAEGLADAVLLRKMHEASSEIVSLLVRLGIQFERSSDGYLVSSCLENQENQKDTQVLHGIGLSRQITQALEKQIRYFIKLGRLTLHESWDCLSVVFDRKSRARGVVAQHLHSMEIKSFCAEALVCATGSMTSLYGRTSLQSRSSLGTMFARLLQQGAYLANCEFMLFEKVSLPEESQQAPVEFLVEKSLGGFSTDEHLMTNLPGVFAAGSSLPSLNGAKSLPGNDLLASLFSGMKVAQEVYSYACNQENSDATIPSEIFDQAVENEKQICADLLDLSGPENQHVLFSELTELMMANAGVVRDNTSLSHALEKITEIKMRAQHVSLSDKSSYCNPELFAMRELSDALCLAQVIFKSALARDESRGGHFKTGFENSNESFSKITKVKWVNGAPVIFYADVDEILSKPLLVNFRG